uniref:Myb-like domain-containing protein n=1 Tax=Calcidiscus leptoporus TaxID=127549 RepID=A0A7S0JJ31_9EUKA|mmetsp:Transcript_60857/g.139542  ORF Transcript_60857/g.139542 Transcript_60857/m.139542 type:complete len:360 (+) Transcript_60857:70-1149(+)
MTASPIRSSTERAAFRRAKSAPYVQLDMDGERSRQPLSPSSPKPSHGSVLVQPSLNSLENAHGSQSAEELGWHEPDDRAIHGYGMTKATWAAAEDHELLSAVRAWGTLWPVVAAQLPGRTPDAVRNRWHRLRHQTKAAAHGGSALATEGSADETSPVQGGGDALVAAGDTHPDSPPSGSSLGRSALAEAPHPERGVHARACWTAHEDDVIMDGVRRHGCKWRQIAAALPNRSDSSVRNRWMRLHTRPICRGGDGTGSGIGQAMDATFLCELGGTGESLRPSSLPSPGAASSSDSVQDFPVAAAATPEPQVNHPPLTDSELKYEPTIPAPDGVAPLPAHGTEDSTAYILVSFASQSITSA